MTLAFIGGLGKSGVEGSQRRVALNYTYSAVMTFFVRIAEIVPLSLVFLSRDGKRCGTIIGGTQDE